MGCGGSKKKFAAVQESTGMTQKEVADSFKAFKKEAGAAKIKLDKFTKLVADMNTNKGGNVTEYAKHLFRVLDADKDGLVSFEEVIVGFHNLSGNGDEKEKLKMVFQMYDIDGNKTLSPENIKMITKAQYQLEGKPLKEEEISQKVKTCFKQCDLNADGKITEEEFFKAGKSIAEMFELEEND
jgi:Ca2+-binding EF-hand superfamily protein